MPGSELSTTSAACDRLGLHEMIPYPAEKTNAVRTYVGLIHARLSPKRFATISYDGHINIIRMK